MGSMGDPAGESGFNIRFRHVAGDIGPFLFPKATTVLGLKERLMQEWPTGKDHALRATRLLLLRGKGGGVRIAQTRPTDSVCGCGVAVRSTANARCAERSPVAVARPISDAPRAPFSFPSTRPHTIHPRACARHLQRRWIGTSSRPRRCLSFGSYLPGACWTTPSPFEVRRDPSPLLCPSVRTPPPSTRTLTSKQARPLPHRLR